MDKGDLKYTEEELIDLGWEQIEPQLPRRKKDRAIWFWLPAAALFLLGGYFLMQKNTDTIPMQSADFELNKAKQSVGEQSKEEPTLSVQESEGFTESMEEDQKEVQVYSLNESISKQGARRLFANEQQQESSSPVVSTRVEMTSKPSGREVRGRTENPKMNNETRKEKYIETQLSKEKDLDTNVAINKTPVQEIKPNSEITQELVEEVISVNQSENQTEDSDPLETQEVAKYIEKAKQKTKKSLSLQPYALAQVQSNEFSNLGPKLGTGISLNFTEKQSISIGANASFLNQYLDSFTTLTVVSEVNNTMLQNVGDAEQPRDYKMIMIELPLTYSHQFTEKIMLNAGVVPTYATFNDFLLSRQSEQTFLVADLENQRTSFTSNLLAEPQINFYRISDEFVNQFDQFSIGFQLGGEVKLRENLSIMGDGSFGYQNIDQTPFLDFAPNFVQIGAKYYFVNQKK